MSNIGIKSDNGREHFPQLSIKRRRRRRRRSFPLFSPLPDISLHAYILAESELLSLIAPPEKCFQVPFDVRKKMCSVLKSIPHRCHIDEYPPVTPFAYFYSIHMSLHTCYIYYQTMQFARWVFLKKIDTRYYKPRDMRGHFWWLRKEMKNELLLMPLRYYFHAGEIKM